MASLIRSSRDHRSEPIHVRPRPRSKVAAAPSGVESLAASPSELSCSPVESFLSSGPRTSIDSTVSDLSFTLDLQSHFSATTLTSSSSASSLVRQPLSDTHAVFIRKMMKKLRPGQQLPACTMRHLGRGGVGEVHLLELDLPDGGRLQLARKAIICRRYDATRHAREVAAMEMAQAGCPFVLRVYGSSYPGKAPYALYTEFAPLGSLHDLIQRRRRAGAGPGGGRAPYFNEHEVRWLAARVLVALSHIHELGLVHRDVSPHNIYRSASGHPLLADFDAAELVDEEGLVHQGGGHAGRIAMAAPEVRAAAFGGGSYGRKADMWSFGAVLLEMVSDEEVADGPKLEGCSEALKALLLEGLLVTQAKRLDAASAMRHPFFNSVDWAHLEYEEAPPGLLEETL